MGLDGAEERSTKQEGRGVEHNLSKNDIAPEHNVNQLKSIGSNQSNFNPQSVNQKTHPEVAEQPYGTVSRGRSGWLSCGWDDPPAH